MALYKVNRRILHNGKPYNPGSVIELTDVQAKRMTNGQVSPAPERVKPSVAPSKPVIPGSPAPLAGKGPQAEDSKPADKPDAEKTDDSRTQAQPPLTGKGTNTAPAK
jgi:hypothetical protein